MSAFKTFAEHPRPAKESYWRRFAAGAWPDFDIQGDGPLTFVSHCEKVVHIFPESEIVQARAAQCSAGANCDPLRGHQRVRIKWLPPIKCGQWERDS